MIGARVEIDEVSFGYSREAPPVVDRVSLELPAGTTTALLGTNGAGKSTLLDLLLGWRQPWSGAITIDGAIRRVAGRRRAEVALVPQSEHVPFDFSLLEYVLLGRAPHLTPFAAPGAADLAAARAAIAEVGLAPFEPRPVPTLSGGERQLAMVARALAQEPRLLLLDEPFSHLDVGNAVRLVALLRRLGAGGLTILLTTHDPSLVAGLADRTALLRGGRLLAAGVTAHVLSAENLTAAYAVPVELVPHGDRTLVVARLAGDS